MSDTLEKARKAIDKSYKKGKDKDNNIIETSFLETDNYILEQINVAEDADNADFSIYKPMYIKYNILNLKERIEVVSENMYREKVYRPIDNKIVSKNKILLPTAATEYGTDEKLIDEMKEFLFKYFQAPEFYEEIIPYIILFYWISDKFPFIPYTHFIGLPKTGKSTALEVMGSICYKGIKASGAITFASLFRLANEFRGTLLLNEFELEGKGSENYRAFVQLLRSGVEDDPVYRIEGEGKKQIEVFEIKSPRIFASQTAIADAALQSRTITINMSQSTRKLPLYRLQEYTDKAQDLRNKLLLWRLRKMSKINLYDIEYGIQELAKFDRRVQQVMTPIYYLAGEKAQKDILRLVKKQEEETYQERMEEIDGQIFMIMQSYWKRGEEVSIGLIASILNENREKQGYKSKITERKISSVVRRILGFNTETRGHDKLAHVVRNDQKVEELTTYYGLNGLLSVTSAKTASSAPASKSIENAEDIVKLAEGIFED